MICNHLTKLRHKTLAIDYESQMGALAYQHIARISSYLKLNLLAIYLHHLGSSGNCVAYL